MSTHQITGVRTVTPPGYTHPHITYVRLGSSAYLTPRETIIANIRNIYGDRYHTTAGGVVADVIVRSCPHCGGSDYITTTPDYTKANNLLSLPRV